MPLRNYLKKTLIFDSPSIFILLIIRSCNNWQFGLSKCMRAWKETGLFDLTHLTIMLRMVWLKNRYIRQYLFSVERNKLIVIFYWNKLELKSVTIKLFHLLTKVLKLVRFFFKVATSTILFRKKDSNPVNLRSASLLYRAIR
mgnify:CR=1 FL=1